jgi:hypothetical protein
MRKKSEWIALALVTLVVSGVLAYFNIPDSDPICRANFDTIKKGMTAQDVENLLGGPCARQLDTSIIYPGATPRVWRGKRCSITVYFGHCSDLVENASFKQSSMLPKWLSGEQTIEW